MFSSLPQPSHLPCPDCGESVLVALRHDHACDEERRLSYRVFQHRAELDALEEEIEAYLESPEGQFALWEAERRREHGG